MITLRKAGDRGYFDHGWLQTSHTFSFGDYHDRAHMGFRALRVINEDHVKPGRGFPTHGHRDMEIVTYVLEGALEHKDSLGNGSVIRPGDVQRMSAGTGVTHSEQNPSASESVHLLQIWILPARVGAAPSYEQRTFSVAERQGQLRLVASADGRDGSVTIQQDVALYAAILKPGDTLSHTCAPARHAWLQVARGMATVNGQALAAGDGAALSDETQVTIVSDGGAEILLFDLA
jgi:redox-sensitive bicupin YhaK (pirin superfamily)